MPTNGSDNHAIKEGKMNTFNRLIPTLILGVGLLSLPATQLHAAQWPDRVSITGFISSVYSKTDQSYPFNGSTSSGDDDQAGIDDKGSFQGTRAGLNISARISDKITFASQLFASREEGTFDSHLDWAFIAYKINDNFTIRSGRIKYPVGIVNEYVSVANAYTWITPPVLYYGERPIGTQATREAYNGLSTLFETSHEDWEFGADLFAGEVTLDVMTIRELSGLTLRADWDDTVLLQASTYSGTMNNENMALMDGEAHAATSFGIKVDWNNIIAYSEVSSIKMGDFKQGESDVMYLTLGYRLGNWIPHITYQEYEKGKNAAPNMMILQPHQKQNITSLGVKYVLDRSSSLKIEYSSIKTDKGVGLFGLNPMTDTNLTDDSATMWSVALDTVF